jgi:hypothetical protein
LSRPPLLAIDVGTLSMHAVLFGPETAARLHADLFAAGAMPRDRHVYGSDTAWCEAQAAACSGYRQPVTIRNRTEVASRRLRSMSRHA